MGTRILIVDDETSVRECIAVILANAAYAIERASSGEEALAMCENQPFDLVLTDSRMAGMDGRQLLTRLRAIAPNQRMILITAFPPADTSLFDDVILKPFSAHELRNRVAAAVAARSNRSVSLPQRASNLAKPITLLVADDHPLLREGLREFLAGQSDVEVIAEACDGAEVIEKAQALHPNVVIMDIGMPCMDGFDATRRLREVTPDVKVLVLTGYDNHELASRVLAVGARGYVSKSSPRSELIAAIRAIHQGEVHFPAHLGPIIQGGRDSSGVRSSATAQWLSNREREMLALIANGLPNKRVALKLGLSVRTIEKHRQRIMDKLNLHGGAELTKYAIKERLICLKPGSTLGSPEKE